MGERTKTSATSTRTPRSALTTPSANRSPRRVGARSSSSVPHGAANGTREPANAKPHMSSQRPAEERNHPTARNTKTNASPRMTDLARPGAENAQTSLPSQNACQRAASGSTDHPEPSPHALRNAQKDGLGTSAKTRLRRSVQTSSHLMPSTTSPSPL